MKKMIRLGILLISSISYSQVGIGTQYPNSTLAVNGSYAGSYKSVAVDADLTIADQFVNVVGASSGVTITLPDAVVADVVKNSFYGRVYHIKNTSSFDVTIKGKGTQLLQTGPVSIANTIIIKSGQSVMVVKNSNNGTTTPLWDIFQQTTVSNDNTIPVGAIKSFRAVVPINIFTANGGTRNIMTGRAVSNTTTTDRRSAYELSNVTDQAKFIVINGLRMDFLEATSSGNVSPKFCNVTSAPITYGVSSLSTNDRYMNGANTTIAGPGFYYSYKIDGDDTFGTDSIDLSEYVNTMITFPNGEWYNCTWHATRDTVNYYFYFTAQRLN
ncbi:hypothetical protein JET18_19045 [Chryseobacterium sp. L7]|uniref:IgGFc-binding protein N-terminal domain-containing protein n=1 Tax=Chryseobacterium endalhagicum TaxID=2797638 RepID=A0ABS1QM37_9FLAO|nr:hypothetical protein [Chryseobacterium endalhagicum]MBL1222958.1 hypothetical protein [Chryseobacterium endalhagicum]